jgi:hypothetical protein
MSRIDGVEAAPLVLVAQDARQMACSVLCVSGGKGGLRRLKLSNNLVC